MKRTIGLFILALSVGCTPKAAPVAQAPPLTVSVSKPTEQELVDYDEYQGQVEASEFIEIRARVNGYLERVHFEDGGQVEAGQVLFTIDPKPYEAEVARTKGDLEQLVARVDRLDKEFARTKKLLETKTASQEEFDRVAGDLGEAKAGLASAQAALDSAQLNLGFTRVTSPISGRVGRHLVSVGNLIVGGGASGSGTLLTTVVATEPIYVYVDASEQKVLKYQQLSREGKRKTARESQVPMFIGLANEKGTPHEGYIDFVDNQLNPETGTIQARGVFDNENNYLTPGFYVRIRVPASQKYQALLVPDRSIGTRQTERYLLIVNDQNEVVYRPVEIGTLHDGMRVITKGIEAGENFIVHALARARAGMTVHPQSIEISAPPEAPVPSGDGDEAEAVPKPADDPPSGEK